MTDTPHSEGRGDVTWDHLRSVHLMAIAGVGMAAVAGMLKARGVSVRGSDEHVYPPMSEVLDRLDIPVHQGYRADNLEPRPDLVIVGNKISRGNAEAVALLASDIPYLSMPAALGRFFLEEKRSLVVAGTHGKTTTSAMLARVLEHAGRDPGLMVGGHALDFSGNYRLGDGPSFVVEGDEYDSAFFDKRPKLVHYRAQAAILNAVEFDHADIYSDLEAVVDAFCVFARALPAGAPFVVSRDYPQAMRVAAAAPQVELHTFGGDGADWSLRNLHDREGELRFDVLHRRRSEGAVALVVPGRINALNALAVYALARCEGLAHEEIAAGLRAFSGVARRQQVVATRDGIILIDDFAHHPTAVSGTLRAMRERYRGRRLWALFEPRSNTSRRSVFQDAYADALALADCAVVAGVFQKQTDRVDASQQLSVPILVESLRARGIDARTCRTAREIADLVVAEAEAGDVVVVMSNGDFGGLCGMLETELPSPARP